MNRFKVRLGKEAVFEDYTLYSSHTVWGAKSDFDAWTHSEAFRQSHKGAGNHGDLYLEHPQFEGFDVVLTAGAAE